MRKKWIWIAPLAILALLAFIALGGWVVSLLWNGLLPALFGWKLITFWQALGILVLCRILFGGWGGHGQGRSSMRRHATDRLADRVAGRWEHMTAEEREQFRKRVLERCGFDPGARSEPPTSEPPRPEPAS